MPSLTTWFNRRFTEGNLPWIVDLALIPVSFFYSVVMRMRSALYRGGVLKTRALDCRVISIGNITVGGTGKTPVVIAFANWLRSAGTRVGVVSRGYRRADENTVVVVSDGRNVLVSPGEAGDEPYLIATRCPGVPVVVGADRYAAGKRLLNQYSCDALLLDDGFQHLAVKRDIDVLLLDATAPFGNGRVFPRGRLREPKSAIRRATAVLITRVTDGEPFPPPIPDLPNVPIAVSRFELTGFVSLQSGAVVAKDAFAGRNCVAFCGIANPSSFRELLESVGVKVRDFLVFADHCPYTVNDLQRIWNRARGSGTDAIVTTEKDAVRILASEREGMEMVAARIELVWLKGQEAFEQHVLKGQNAS